MSKTIMALINDIQNTDSQIDFANTCTLEELKLLYMFGYSFICEDGMIAEVAIKRTRMA